MAYDAVRQHRAHHQLVLALDTLRAGGRRAAAALGAAGGAARPRARARRAGRARPGRRGGLAALAAHEDAVETEEVGHGPLVLAEHVVGPRRAAVGLA